MQIGARINTGADGLRTTELVTTTAGRVTSEARTIPLDESRKRLVDIVLGCPVVPPRLGEDVAAERLVDAFVEGLGSDAEAVLSAYLDRAAARLVSLVTSDHRRWTAKPKYDQVVQTDTFGPPRIGRPVRSGDRSGKFSRSTGYTGWTRSMYEQVWFDSATERQLAGILDDAEDVEYWVRLNTGDLPILWQSDGREYNPDFIAVDSGGVHWLVESKMNKEMESVDVRGKENAAQRWGNHVSSQTGVNWRYLLVSEDDVDAAHGSWSALKKLGR